MGKQAQMIPMLISMFDHHYQETEYILVTHLIHKTFLILASKIQAHTIELAISEMEE